MFTYHFTVADVCGNDVTCDVVYSGGDRTDPVITCPGNQIRCIDAFPMIYTVVGSEFDPVYTFDNCSVASVTYHLTGATTGTGTGLSGVILNPGATNVEWTILDACNNTASCSYTVSVVQKPTPVVTGPASVLTGTSATYSTDYVAGYAYVWNVTGEVSFTGQGSTSIHVVWGAPGPGTVSVTALNIATGCIGYSLPLDVTITMLTYKVSGYFTYNNTANTPLDNIHLDLKSGSLTVASATTQANGYFEFLNVEPGTYTVSETTNKPEGGINTTDASAVNSWWVAVNPIERVKWNAGDANNSNEINATDASLIQGHFVYGTDFPRGVWTFAKQPDVSSLNPPVGPNTLIVTGADVVQNYYGLCVGDFNRSNNPPAGKVPYEGKSGLSLEYSGVQYVAPDTEFELPVYVTSAMQVGAISLILDYPADLALVEGVYLTNGKSGSSNQDIPFNVNGNELRIGWTSINPLELSSSDQLITIKMKTLTTFVVGQSIKMMLVSNVLNELADGFATPVGNAVLNTNVIEASATGINDQSAGSLSLNNHPNPFTDYTVISYSLPTDGKVVAELHNLIGARVSTLVNEVQKQGKHDLRLEGAVLSPGIYTVTIQFTTGNTVEYRTIKIVRNR